VATLSKSHGLVVEPSSVEEGGEYSDLLRVEVARAEKITFYKISVNSAGCHGHNITL
jgi:hypothetical protein